MDAWTDCSWLGVPGDRVEEYIEPVLKAYRGQSPKRHLVVVAHGIFNSEFLGALLARRKDLNTGSWEYRGEYILSSHALLLLG